MYRAILPDGTVTGAAYESTDHGIELYTEDGSLIAFVPYSNLVALMNDAVTPPENRSIR